MIVLAEDICTNMFSKTALKLLKRSVQAADVWSVLPIKWSRKSDGVEMVRGKRRQYLWLVSFLGLTMDWIFVLTRYINLSILDPTAKGTMKVYSLHGILGQNICHSAHFPCHRSFDLP